MLLAFEATLIAETLRKFSEEQLWTLELLVNTETRKLTVEVVGLGHALKFLEHQKMVEGKDFRRRDAITVAGAVILEIEREREKG